MVFLASLKCENEINNFGPKIERNIKKNQK